MLSKIIMALKIKLFVGNNVAVGARFHIGLWSFVSASESLSIGNDVYIGKFCSIQVNGSIGAGVLIANNVGVIGRLDHDYRTVGVPIRYAPWVGSSRRLAADPKNSINVGADVWIGFGAVLVSGISIGRGSVIAAGAVVSRDVPAYAIVSGNPAQIVGHRFNSEQILQHEINMTEVTL